MDRKQFLRTTTLLGVGTLTLGPVAALLEGSEPTPIPTRVGATEIEQIRAAARVFTGWESTYGGGFARDAALAQLRWSAGLLDATCPTRLHPELFSAVGDLAETTGTMAFDAGTHEDARRVFGFALGCAEQAEDWHLRATVLSTMAVQAIRTGRPDEGLTLSEQALVRADRLTATERAVLHTDRARALAKMRRVNETLTALGAADDHFAHSTPADDPPFMTAAAGQTARHVRARAICLTKLASLTMATGDPLHAVTIGIAALGAVGTIRSRRALEGLRELNRHAAAHQHLDEVAHLRHRIGTLLVDTNNP